MSCLTVRSSKITRKSKLAFLFLSSHRLHFHTLEVTRVSSGRVHEQASDSCNCKHSRNHTTQLKSGY